jgi:hypothetical protein
MSSFGKSKLTRKNNAKIREIENNEKLNTVYSQHP